MGATRLFLHKGNGFQKHAHPFLRRTNHENHRCRSHSFSHQKPRPECWLALGYGVWIDNEEVEGTSAITRISTDEGVTGHMLGGNKATMEGAIKNLLVGEDPLNREKLWHWMDQMSTFGHSLAEHELGIVDCALWDLAGQKAGMPVYQLLGGTRDKVEAYASTYPNLGGPEV